MPNLAVVPDDASPDTIPDLLASFALSLRALGRSPHTVRLYVGGAKALAQWLDANGHPTAVQGITQRDVATYLLDLTDHDRAPNTVATAYRAARAFFAWAVHEGVLATDPTARLRGPAVPERLVPVLTDDELKAIIGACEGRDFAARRDMALVRLLADTGMRRAEIAAMTVADIDGPNCTAHIRVGKGGRGRVVGYGDKTALALDRYLRMRRVHPKAALDSLWLSARGPLSHSSLRDAVVGRARSVGVTCHLHSFRHAFAHRFLAAGGQEGDLMRLGGWRNATMIHTRYGAALGAERAIEAAHRLRIGDAF